MYKPLCLKWITSKDLLYSSGSLLNVIQQPGWEVSWVRVDTCIYTAESLCCPPVCVYLCVCVHAHTHLLSHVQLLAPSWTVAHQTPLFVGFPRQEYWSGWPFPTSTDLPDPGIEPAPPALQADSLPLSQWGNLLST